MVASLHDRGNLSDIRWISDGFASGAGFNKWPEKGQSTAEVTGGTSDRPYSDS